MSQTCAEKAATGFITDVHLLAAEHLRGEVDAAQTVLVELLHDDPDWAAAWMRSLASWLATCWRLQLAESYAFPPGPAGPERTAHLALGGQRLRNLADRALGPLV